MNSNTKNKISFALVPLVCASAYCTPCELWILANNIINFLVFDIATPVLVLAFLAGGIVLLSSSGSPAQIEKGKKIITSSLVGILIALGGWLIVDTIIKTLAEGKPIAAWGNMPACEKPAISPPPPSVTPIPIAPPTGVTPTFDNQANANYLANNGVAFNADADCSDAQGNKVSAQTNLQELRSAQGLTVCQSGCKNSLSGKFCQKTSATLDAKLLPELITAKNGGASFSIESLTTGDHAPNSDHYKGKAADLIAGSQNDYMFLRQQLRALNPPSGGYDPNLKIFCEDARGKAVEGCNVPATTHLHFSVP